MSELNLTTTAAHVRHGSNIGQPMTRRDGILKVKGQASYAADHHPQGMLFAVVDKKLRIHRRRDGTIGQSLKFPVVCSPPCPEDSK